MDADPFVIAERPVDHAVDIGFHGNLWLLEKIIPRPTDRLFDQSVNGKFRFILLDLRPNAKIKNKPFLEGLLAGGQTIA